MYLCQMAVQELSTLVDAQLCHLYFSIVEMYNSLVDIAHAFQLRCLRMIVVIEKLNGVDAYGRGFYHI